MFKWFTPTKTESPSEAESPAQSAETLSPVSAFDKLKNAMAETGKTLFGFGVASPSISSDANEPDLPIDEDDLEALEENLIRADVGVETALMLVEKARTNIRQIQTQKGLHHFLKNEFSAILMPFAEACTLNYQPGLLNIYLVVGVNGAGKTTFIGKLAKRFKNEGKKVLIGAGDTFRAAAEEQLEVWAGRAGAEIVRQDGADPAAVIFDTLVKAKQDGVDVVLLDTAGRLQNKFNLMEELKKVYRVIEKERPENAVLESLLVLDATTGQNALKQAEVFKEAVDLTGVVLTKLDGSAKGGVVLAVAREFNLPVKMIGIGEKIEDLKPFDPAEFVEALFSRN